MMMPEKPEYFVERPAEFDALKGKLLDAKGDLLAITAALRGAGGYGKTTLAKALVHDPEIEDAYFDGILWAGPGEKPDNLLSIVADLIEIISGERPGLSKLNSAAAKLAEALGDRRILLVIDDAWREQDLRPFLQGGEHHQAHYHPPGQYCRQKPSVGPWTPWRRMRLFAPHWDLPNDQAAAQALGFRQSDLGEWALLLSWSTASCATVLLRTMSCCRRRLWCEQAA